jgi:hypothetical protein
MGFVYCIYLIKILLKDKKILSKVKYSIDLNIFSVYLNNHSKTDSVNYYFTVMIIEYILCVARQLQNIKRNLYRDRDRYGFHF